MDADQRSRLKCDLGVCLRRADPDWALWQDPPARSRDDGKALACVDCCVSERWERRGQSWQAEFVLAAARYPGIQGSKDVGSILTGLADWHQRARAPPHPQKSRVLPARLQAVQVYSVSSFVHDDPGPVLTTISIVAWYLTTWALFCSGGCTVSTPPAKDNLCHFTQVLRQLDAKRNMSSMQTACSPKPAARISVWARG